PPRRRPAPSSRSSPRSPPSRPWRKPFRRPRFQGFREAMAVRRLVVSARQPKDPDRLRNAPKVVRAEVLVRQPREIRQKQRRLGEADLARTGHPQKPRGHVHRLAEDITALQAKLARADR